MDYLASCFLGKQNDQEMEDLMERSQEPSSRLVGMSCDYQSLSDFLKDEKIIFIDPKSEYNTLLEQEVSLWK
ncbi:hypothetical protein [Acetobacterium sp.]|uniref:hypothetical protein n=1 Tax=Acetobacterium sp. TaxID=1872094 RepID=UPI0027181E92|nr:hypothetical protein [Acetobacterium sp.]MDO9492002.1 hypothetical protein [Acetobacterium sp.]